MSRHEFVDKDRWATAREKKIAQIDVLPRGRAILGILRIVKDNDGDGRVSRLLLEGIAYLANHPQFKYYDCRLLKSFNNPDDNNNIVGLRPGGLGWRLNFHESLAWLQQMGYVDFASGWWSLNQYGNRALDSYIKESGAMPIQKDESETIMEMVGLACDRLTPQGRVASGYD